VIRKAGAPKRIKNRRFRSARMRLDRARYCRICHQAFDTSPIRANHMLDAHQIALPGRPKIEMPRQDANVVADIVRAVKGVRRAAPE